MEQRLNRLGRTPVSPVRVHARAYSKSQRGTSVTVRHVDRRSAFDEESHGRVARTPGRDVKRQAVLRYILANFRSPGWGGRTVPWDRGSGPLHRCNPTAIPPSPDAVPRVRDEVLTGTGIHFA
jgi:hypothetical protein